MLKSTNTTNSLISYIYLTVEALKYVVMKILPNVYMRFDATAGKVLMRLDTCSVSSNPSVATIRYDNFDNMR